MTNCDWSTYQLTNKLCQWIYSMQHQCKIWFNTNWNGKKLKNIVLIKIIIINQSMIIFLTNAWHVWFLIFKYVFLMLRNSRTSHFSWHSVETDAKELFVIAWQTTHQCTKSHGHLFSFPSSNTDVFGVTCECFRPWGRSAKCIVNLLQYHLVFLAMHIEEGHPD